ncbi:PREDICTED: FUN14 domain-containing protein 2 [Charadrius vociferus]|uniref:FUN14 domain-containing protein 2 n=1 Tax=Charadrius vociferus TaxID=50402 RepID=UPI000521AAAC|nr:PREDICTED: FUN14 domain-containing protein 2 [Charadrius vociferus]
MARVTTLHLQELPSDLLGTGRLGLSGSMVGERGALILSNAMGLRLPRSGNAGAFQLPESVKEDSFNVLDLAEYTKNRPWWRKVFAPSSGSSAEKYNVATQLVIGGVTGWCTGFIFQKVGKLAATAVGGGFFLLQIANHTGYIKVDWKLVERDVNKAKQQLKFHSSGNKVSPEVKSKVDEVIIFLKKNVILTGGFAGGFLLGMAS